MREGGCGPLFSSLGPIEANEASELADLAVGIWRHPGFADVAIAAVAKAHGLASASGTGSISNRWRRSGVTVFDLAGME